METFYTDPSIRQTILQNCDKFQTKFSLQPKNGRGLRVTVTSEDNLKLKVKTLKNNLYKSQVQSLDDHLIFSWQR